MKITFIKGILKFISKKNDKNYLLYYNIFSKGIIK